MERGYVQVYTGDGKGKTTAAIGLSMRALGAGMKVFFAQFVKGMEYSELDLLKRFGDQLIVRQYGTGCFIVREPSAADIAAAREGLAEAREAMQSGRYDLVVLDEANIATYFKLFSVEELLEAISSRSPGTEIVVTGRRADPRLIETADLVTEMREIKHYYQQGVQARTGIEK